MMVLDFSVHGFIAVINVQPLCLRKKEPTTVRRILVLHNTKQY